MKHDGATEIQYPTATVYCTRINIIYLSALFYPHIHKKLLFSLVPDLDGKLYDAYVAYPQPCAVGFSEKVESFALHTLPQVLENACGYKLFIAGRDCLPGQGT